MAAATQRMNLRDSFHEIPLVDGDGSAPLVDAGARLPAFVGGPGDAVVRLSAIRALVVGAGSIGFEFIQQLARWQVAEIGIVDPKKFKRESVLTHAAPPEAVGQSKAGYAARLAKRLSPRTKVSALEGVFASVPLSRLAQFDAVFLATDNLLAELQVGRACFPLGLPVVQGSVHGETLSGHVRCYGHGGPSAPCVACGFSREEWAHLNRSSLFSCEGLGAQPAATPNEGQPTMSVHALCSLVAQLALLQFAKDRLSLGAVRDTVLEYCAYPQTLVTSKLASHPRCPGPHVAFRRASPPRPLADCSLHELSRAAADDATHGQSASFEVDDFQYVERALCPCGAEQPVQRFVRADAHDIGRCWRCLRPLPRQPFHSLAIVPGSALGETINRPLRDLGASDARWVVLRRALDAVLFLNSAPPISQP